jgi:hypothetical protein
VLKHSAVESGNQQVLSISKSSLSLSFLQSLSLFFVSLIGHVCWSLYESDPDDIYLVIATLFQQSHSISWITPNHSLRLWSLLANNNFSTTATAFLKQNRRSLIYTSVAIVAVVSLHRWIRRK